MAEGCVASLRKLISDCPAHLTTGWAVIEPWLCVGQVALAVAQR